MRDRSSLILAVVIALAIFVGQQFVKLHVLSSTNMETAGKLQRLFQGIDVLPVLQSDNADLILKPVERRYKPNSIQSKKALPHGDCLANHELEKRNPKAAEFKF